LGEWAGLCMWNPYDWFLEAPTDCI
jgi:hypothetical protein